MVNYESQNEADTQLHGRWLVLAWIVWLALVVPNAVTFLAGLPGYREIEYQSNLFPALGTIMLLRWLNIFVYEHLFLCIPLSIGAALLGSRLWKKERAQEPMPHL